MDEYGHTTNANIGSTAATWSYDTNKMLSQIAATGVQKYDYSFDVNTGNLSLRKNVLKDKTENFFYGGNLDCLGATVSFIQSGQPPQVISTSYTPDNNGNILPRAMPVLMNTMKRLMR